ncbi:MAG: asparagine synthase (glutamine-hydrolyzing) [Pseudomonadota bacterium]
MCGIAGFLLNTQQHHLPNSEQTARNIARHLRFRGPDHEGYWADEAQNIHLIHRRLAVVDLTPTGAQPMGSRCGRYQMSYNGEVYNAAMLARHLKQYGYQFKGTSDTEVILEAFTHWGIEETVKKLVGMFTIGVWDKKQKELILIRDRLGIKPLYWGEIDGTYLFSSQLNALQAFPYWHPKINLKAVGLYLYYGYVPAPHSIIEGMYKIQPGEMVYLKQNHPPRHVKYWSLSDEINKEQPRQMFTHYDESCRASEHLLKDAVSCRMVADVPFGAFLSGGIDSSLVASLMQQASTQPIKTFSMGFDQPVFNEACEAKKIAKHLKTDHHELYMSDREALDIMPQIGNFYDEPFYDSSSIPTYLLSKLTRRYVTVALSGDGGDEVFGGYNRYIHAQKLRRFNHFMPHPLRQMLGHMMQTIPMRAYDLLTIPIQKATGLQMAGYRAHKLAGCILANDEHGIYTALIRHFDHLYPETLSKKEIEDLRKLHPLPKSLSNFIEKMQYYDILTYLNDDILTKVDRASMAHSLEVRVPLIDHRMVELSWHIPVEHKIKNGKGKAVLRSILKQYVPEHLFERPKMGFAIPIDRWLKGPLREWADDIIKQTDWQNAFEINASHIHTLWESYLKSASPSPTQIWVLIALGVWHKQFLSWTK